MKKPLLFNLYKDVKIPWVSLVFGSFLAVFNALVILTQFDNYNAIFSGTMSDLTPLWAYLIASFIQYVLIFATVICDLGYVKIVTGVRQKMWRKMVRLPMKTYDEQSANGLLSRITSDAEYASRPFYVIIVLLQIFVYVLSISAAAPKNLPQALMILVITLSLSMIAIVVSAKAVSKATTSVQNTIATQTSNYVEQLGNVKYIKATNSQEKAIEVSLGLIEERYQASLDRAFANALQTLASNCTYIIIYSCAFLGGILAIKAGSISDIQPVNQAYVFGMAAEATLVAFMTIPTYFASTFGGSKKLVEVFDFPEEDIITGKELALCDEAIKVEHVDFSYGNKEVLKDVSFVIEKGKKTALIGPNGSGKSTIINLIDRLYESDKGDLMIGNQKASDISLKSWREKFGYVSQKASLFAGSIKENICYGL
ncbi:MAG: ABC transporter ATP-binding protein, partial [Erysipelotrichaceae bacterium]|nr:ABC transporter ATP-binding protein [Erysipelotrichaceae bacterium]